MDEKNYISKLNINDNQYYIRDEETNNRIEEIDTISKKGEQALESINQVFGFNYTFDFINANWDSNTFDITDKTIGRQQQLKDCKILYLGSDNTGAIYPQEGTRNNNGYHPSRQTKLRIVDVYPGTNVTLKTLNITGESILNNSSNLKLISDTTESNIHTITLEVIDTTNTYINLQNVNYTYYREIRIFSNETIFPFRTEFETINDKIHSISAGGGVIYVEKYDDTSLYNALTLALADTSDYTVYDCTYFTGTALFDDTIYINKPCTILFGNITITSHGLNFFKIQSNNVQIIGYHRATDRTNIDIANSTVLIMDQNSVTNDAETGYHIYSKGNKNLRFEYLTLKGIQTSLGRQCGSNSAPINGCGGIHLDKQNPCITQAGNTCNNIIINQLLIDGTKAHGIYISTPILATITNTRLSAIGGHGIFLNGATSSNLTNVYMASANLAGFCLLTCTYCSLNNCVAENCGIGFLVRGSFNVSLFSPGVEYTISRGDNPWGNLSNPGFNIYASGYDKEGNPSTILISDVNSDLRNSFTGTPFMVVGGRGVSLYTPYATDIVSGGSYNASTTALLRIRGNARMIYVNNIKGNKLYYESASDFANIYNDIRIEANNDGSPNGVEIVSDLTDYLLKAENVRPFIEGKYITHDPADYATVYQVPTARNVLLRNGSTFYTPVTFNDNVNVGILSLTQMNADSINLNNRILINGLDNTIQILNKEYSAVSHPVTIYHGYQNSKGIDVTSQTDPDVPKRITTDFIAWDPNNEYNLNYVDEDGITQTSGRIRLTIYNSDNTPVLNGSNAIRYTNNGTFSSTEIKNFIDAYLTAGKHMKLAFWRVGDSTDPANPDDEASSFSVITNEISYVPKVTFDGLGNAYFAGNVIANNITSNNDQSVSYISSNAPSYDVKLGTYPITDFITIGTGLTKEDITISDGNNGTYVSQTAYGELEFNEPSNSTITVTFTDNIHNDTVTIDFNISYRDIITNAINNNIPVSYEFDGEKYMFTMSPQILINGETNIDDLVLWELSDTLNFTNSENLCANTTGSLSINTGETSTYIGTGWSEPISFTDENVNFIPGETYYLKYTIYPYINTGSTPEYDTNNPINVSGYLELRTTENNVTIIDHYNDNRETIVNIDITSE